MTRAQEIADELIGQCVVTLEQILERDNDEETASLLAAVDQLVFCCDGCGWYCSTDELNNDDGEELCDDCDNDHD